MATTNLSNEELQQLQQIQNKNRAVVQELGQIALAEIDLDKRQENAENYLENLRKEEAELGKALQDKYGQGNVNLETGEFEGAEATSTGAETVDIPKIVKEEAAETTEEESAE